MTIFNKYREQILYIFFGGCTTLLNILIFYFLSGLFPSSTLADIPAEIIAMTFAYITNKLWVFEKSNKSILKEAFEFFLGRLFTLLLSLGLIYILIDVLILPSLPIKIIVSVLVIIINYVISKLIVFKN